MVYFEICKLTPVLKTKHTTVLYSGLYYDPDLEILKGKVELYKQGYHVLLRQSKKMSSERKKLKKEIARLCNLLKMHEDLSYFF